MNDLMLLLDRAAGTGSVTDPAADLARGRRALSRTRRRRSATGLIGVAAAGVLGVGAVQRLTDDGHSQVAETLEATVDDHLRPGRTEAGPFSFDVTPVGWSVQGHRPGSVTFAADDRTSDPHPDAFVGKIVLLFDTERLHGDPIVRDGREFWVSESDDAITVATHTRTGEPVGAVRLMVPRDLDWSSDTAIDMLAGVRVGDGAQAPYRNPDATYEEGPEGYIILGD